MNPEKSLPPENPDTSIKQSPPSFPGSTWWPFAVGLITGIAIRLVFSNDPGKAYSTMMTSFIFCAPTLVGMATIYAAERIERRSWKYYLWASALSSSLFVLGTLIIMIEGFICAILIFPLFVLLGMIGGLLMGFICRKTNWPKRGLYSFALLPLLLGSVEQNLPLPQKIQTLEQHIYIAAPPKKVWEEIWNVRDIKAEEVDQGWMYRIGVPLPKAGVTVSTSEGMVRKITMGKNIHFDQVVTDWRINEYVRWRYHFAADSFPPGALDDHVKIGGAYFDLQTTSYRLTQRGAGTELEIQMQYRISTQFNWYTNPIAELLIGNFEEVILNFYKRRSELHR
jgi:hypothetical protein